MMEFMEPKRTAFTKQELKHYEKVLESIRFVLECRPVLTCLFIKLINESTKDVAVKNIQYLTR